MERIVQVGNSGNPLEGLHTEKKDPMVEKIMELLNMSPEDRAKLEAARKPMPAQMNTDAEIFETARQHQIEGMLAGGTHLAFIQRNATELVNLGNGDEIQKLMSEDKGFLLWGLLHNGLALPVYFKDRNWTMSMDEARLFHDYEHLKYWYNKLRVKHRRILRALFAAYRKDS